MQRQRIITLEETLALAKTAKFYARSQIIKGSSWLINNALPPLYFRHLKSGIGHEKTATVGIRDLIDDIINYDKKHDPLETDRFVAAYEVDIAVTSKYSIGNCIELAFQTLDYILTYSAIEINAECFKIKGGDHSFVVLNRIRDSDPADPLTWGQNAVICDAWADDVYPASQYALKLHNYYYADKKNHAEKLNPSRHTLAPILHMNSEYMKINRSAEKLKINFEKTTHYIINVVRKYKNDLLLEHTRLVARYGNYDAKTVLLTKKMKEIEEDIKYLIYKSNNVAHSIINSEYRIAKKSLMSTLAEIHNEAVAAMQFSQSELTILHDYHSSAFIKSMMNFFNIQPASINHVKIITEEVNNALRPLR